jgi:hypothetical protein
LNYGTRRSIVSGGETCGVEIRYEVVMGVVRQSSGDSSNAGGSSSAVSALTAQIKRAH